MNKYDNLDTFLKLNKSKPKKTISHTRIGNKTVPIIYGGSYNIINDDISEFYKLYYKKVFVQNIDMPKDMSKIEFRNFKAGIASLQKIGLCNNMLKIDEGINKTIEYYKRK